MPSATKVGSSSNPKVTATLPSRLCRKARSDAKRVGDKAPGAIIAALSRAAPRPARDVTRHLPLMPHDGQGAPGSGLLARRAEAQEGPVAHGGVEVPGVAREIYRRRVVVLGQHRAMAVDETLELGFVAVDPARRLVGRGLEPDADLVLAPDARRQHVELQPADDADDPVAAGERLEDARHAFLGELLQRASQMLRLHRVVEPDAAQDLRREIGDAGHTDLVTFGERVADAQGAMIGDAEDVARPRLLGEVALARQEEHRVLHAHEPAAPRMLQLHAAAEAAGAEAQEGDAVAVLRVDVGLHLEDESR